MTEEGIEEVRVRARQHAKDKGYVLNVNEKQLSTVLRGLARNIERFGAAYCPCRLRSGDPEKDKVIICPCIYLDEEVEEKGMCHCRLFFKKESD